jgi:peptide/nickel transport system ATP-binding protein
LAIAAGEGVARKTITVGVDLALGKGETVGIVGESGSGKSLTARAIVGVLPAGVQARGQVLFDGADLLALPERAVRQVRGRRVAMMFQDPFTMLNPLMRCGQHIGEMLPRGLTHRQRAAETQRRLDEVGIGDPEVARRYPFQLSGGMRQRVALAAALARDPDLLIADEPSTALDVTTQAEIMKLLRSVQRGRGMSLVLITHDLRLAFSTCDRVYVLYAGSLLEVGGARAIEAEPSHPYTLGLLLSEPPARTRLAKLIAIRGAVPAADDVRGECSFAARCDWVQPRCRAGTPPLVEVAPGRISACLRFGEIRDEMRALRRSAFAEDAAPGATVSPPLPPLLRLVDVRKTFRLRGARQVQAVKGVSLDLMPGESVGIVGESGSGKTTLARCVVGLETPDCGRIEVAGVAAQDYAALAAAERARVRAAVQMVFQDPYSTLNPKHSVRLCLMEALGARPGQARPSEAQVLALLREVGLPESYAARRPARLSGGERQRVAIARALAVKPSLLVCDEPVSALDVSVQAQILNLFKRLRAEHGLAYLFITHDLAVVRQVVDRVLVLYRGEVVEQGATEEVLSRPQHPYTRRLIDSIPGTTTA